MFLRQLFDTDSFTYTYLVADEATHEAALIDPVRGQAERDLKLIDELGLALRYALDTHVHADHVTAAGVLKMHTGCRTVASALGPESADMRLPDGATIRLGSLTVEVIATPGHTDDSVSYRVGGHLFTGDALFVRGTGRTDFQHGDAGQLYDSISRRIFTLSDDTVIWPGHDYRGHTCSTVGEEKRWNPRLAGKTREQFIGIMAALGLPPPKHIHEAVPANRELGLGISQAAGPEPFEECDGHGAYAMLGQARIIDVREPHEFTGELGHMPGAENIPMREFPAIAADWTRDEPLLIVCRSGRRSREVCAQLAAIGFRQLTNLRDGMLEYRAGGH